MLNKYLLSLISFASIALSSTCWAAVEICESSASIMARADDEYCQLHVEAAQSCWDKLNLRYSYFIERGEEASTKDLLEEGKPLEAHYEDGLKTVRGYLTGLKKIKCGDEKEKIRVMIEAFEDDLKDIRRRLARLKDK